MSFGKEAEMTRPVHRWLEKQGLWVKSEYVTPWGICDLVGVEFRQPSVLARQKLAQTRPIGPLHRITLLHMIPDSSEGKCVTAKRLRKETYRMVLPRGLEYELEKLQRGHFIISPKQGHYQRENGWMPLHHRILAIELKLKRISEALFQAAAHVKFATESYVAFPAYTAYRVISSDRKSEFEKARVGILAISRRKCEIVLRATSNDGLADPVVQSHCVERFWRTHITGN